MNILLKQYFRTFLISAVTIGVSSINLSAFASDQISNMHHINLLNKNSENSNIDQSTTDLSIDKSDSVAILETSTHTNNVIASNVSNSNPVLDKKVLADNTSYEQPVTEIEARKDRMLVRSLREYVKAKKQNPTVIDALYTASKETGVNFKLMIVKTMIDRNLYADTTWLALMKRHGKKIGYASYANALRYDHESKQFSTDKKSRISLKDILALRNDAKVSALIKAYQIIDEQAVLKEYKKSGEPTITDHYVIHVLGLPLARVFYSLKDGNSPIILAYLKNGAFNEVIARNPSFFYDENKNALNASQIYDRFSKSIEKKLDTLRAINKMYGEKDQSITKQDNFTVPVAPNYQSRKTASRKLVVQHIEPAAGTQTNTQRAVFDPIVYDRHISTSSLLEQELAPLPEYR